MSQLPPAVEALIGERCYESVAALGVSRSNIRALCAAVRNHNPVYWNREQALAVAGEEVAPASMLAVWSRPDYWSPAGGAGQKALQLHHDLKELLAYPTAIVSGFESVFHQPVVVGERLCSAQILRSVSDEKDTRLGRGRFWEIEVQYHNQHNELAGLESFDCFAYRRPEA